MSDRIMYMRVALIKVLKKIPKTGNIHQKHMDKAGNATI